MEDRRAYYANLIVLALFLLLAAPMPARSQANLERTTGGDVIFGVRGGYSLAMGYYENLLSSSYYVGLHVIPYVHRFVLLELDAYYSSYPLHQVRSGSIHSLSMSIGPLFYYQLVPALELYAGVALKGNYFHLSLDGGIADEDTYKPGVIVKGGFFIPLKWGVRARIGAEYSYNRLSDKDFHVMNIYGGISYNVPAYRRTRTVQTRENAADKVGRELTLGHDAQKSGDMALAKEHFKRALAIDRGNGEAKQSLQAIADAETQLDEGRHALGSGDDTRALSLLAKAAPVIPAAATELAMLREKLSAEIPELEKKGIALYEQKQYKECIGVFERLLLIDPENRTGNLYLPRARIRNEALRKLQ